MVSGRALISAGQAARIARSSVGASSSRFASSSSSNKGKGKAASSQSQPSTSEDGDWTPALPQGQSAAYDLAVEYLHSHRDSLLSRATKLQSGQSSPSTSAEIDRLSVEALVNDPATRRLFRETDGEGHMVKAVMRHLAERKWRKEGGLDLLMQRIHQLSVVPDLLPNISGHVAPLRILDSTGREVEPGSTELPSRWATPPNLRVQLFDHPTAASSSTPFPTGLYTLLLIDPDSPSHETQSFTQRIHYAKTDIPLSVLSGSSNLFDPSVGQDVLAYEPPAPPQGTGKHRYTYILLHQPSTLSIPEARDAFDLRNFLLEANLSSENIIAISLFRAKWSEEEDAYIREAYRASRGVEMPAYRKPPKEMRYGYPMSSKARQAEQIRQAAWDDAVADLEGIGAEVEQMELRQAVSA